MNLSIICASFNRSKTIERCIESVIEQTEKDWELIIVDDGSIDNTLKIIKRYENDSRIKIFSLINNRGVGYSRNFGIKHATGNWIILLDSDNALHEKALDYCNDISSHNLECKIISDL